MSNKLNKKLITVDLTNCKNWKECEKIIDSITSGRVQINVSNIKK